MHVINHDKTIVRNLYHRPVSNLSRICKRGKKKEARSTRKCGDEFRIRTINEYRFYIFKGRFEIPGVCIDIATEDKGALVENWMHTKKNQNGTVDAAAVISFLGAFCSPRCEALARPQKRPIRTVADTARFYDIHGS